MKQLRYQLRYALPIWLIMLATSILPDNRVTLALRGRLLALVISCEGPPTVAARAMLVNVERLHLGKQVYIGPGVWINGLGGVSIEDEVMLGPYVCVASTSHGFAEGSVARGGTHAASVRIGYGTWLGAHAVVAAGVRIGRSNLVAANAVVTKDTADDVIVGGVPARELRKRIDNPGVGGGRVAF